MTIFVVDDRRDCRLPLARLLKSHGYDPVCLANGREALAALESRPPALILLDISMPVMDGLTFLSVLRADGRWDSLPVIVISGERSEVPLNRARELGANEVLAKSQFSAKQLLASIRRHLAVRGQDMPSAEGGSETETEARSE